MVSLTYTLILTMYTYTVYMYECVYGIGVEVCDYKYTANADGGKSSNVYNSIAHYCSIAYVVTCVAFIMHIHTHEYIQCC